jgi:dTDP-glucose 4,6-dehydratase
MKKFLITGGAGFIGSAVVRRLLRETDVAVAVYDCMTYAASPTTLREQAKNPRFRMFEANICNPLDVCAAFESFQPDAIMHLAAESHVDRSIEAPAIFVQTNVVGTQVMLDAALSYWRGMDKAQAASFRFHHISTDEVFGSLGPEGKFDETTAYEPRSPYSASKAAADHLVRAWYHTFGLPVLLTNCSNNYGPYHFPEKLIPLMILRALAMQPMPVYGDGQNVRDWLHVDDHADALWRVVRDGRVGEAYCIGGDAQRSNVEVARLIARTVDELAPTNEKRHKLIRFVADRPGHDRRYAINTTKIKCELGWTQSVTFEEGLRQTVAWYLDNRDWWQPILDKSYRLERRGILAS